jgi:hypothetical protein
MVVSEALEGSIPRYGHEVYKGGLILKCSSMMKFVSGTGEGLAGEFDKFQAPQRRSNSSTPIESSKYVLHNH